MGDYRTAWTVSFDEKTITPEWLVTCRLIASGSVILLGLFLKRRLEIFTIWKDKKDALHMIIYSVAGMMAVQYSFFIAVEASNGGTATVLQYTNPVMIILYLAFFKRYAQRRRKHWQCFLRLGNLPVVYEWKSSYACYYAEGTLYGASVCGIYLLLFHSAGKIDGEV